VESNALQFQTAAKEDRRCYAGNDVLAHGALVAKQTQVLFKEVKCTVQFAFVGRTAFRQDDFAPLGLIEFVPRLAAAPAR
jgi:hypothetical protein